MTLTQVVIDVLLSVAVLAAVLLCAYRVVVWARRRAKRAYVVGALFAPFMALGKVTDPDFRIVNEAKQLKKREEDEPGDPPNPEDEDQVETVAAKTAPRPRHR